MNPSQLEDGVATADAARVIDFIKRTFLVDADLTIDEDTPLLDAGVFDSMGVLEMVDFLEKTYDRRLAGDDITPENFSSVRRILTMLDAKDADR